MMNDDHEDDDDVMVNNINITIIINTDKRVTNSTLLNITSQQHSNLR